MDEHAQIAVAFKELADAGCTPETPYNQFTPEQRALVDKHMPAIITYMKKHHLEDWQQAEEQLRRMN